MRCNDGKLSFGHNTFLHPAIFAPKILLSKPPISIILPERSISPVIAISLRIFLPDSREYIAVVIAAPALGPSLGVAPSGQCT